MKQVTISTPFITLIVLNYGAIIQKLLIKDKEGNSFNAVVGFDFPNNYIKDNIFLGACVGRFAGRISNGGFYIDRQFYHLFEQKGIHLHGGQVGFGRKEWQIKEVHHGRQPFVTLTYESKHLEEGYPGNLTAAVTYKLINNALIITHQASTDRATVVNLTNHSYFKVDHAPTINNWRLKLNASQMAETFPNMLPTGKLVATSNTSFDFLTEKELGSTRLNTPFKVESSSEVAARISSDKSGISLEVFTDQPAMVVYTPATFPAICFETQNFPDAPNQANFPSSILRPGEHYKNESTFIFDLL